MFFNKKKVAINGLGRIGRIFLKIALQNSVNVVAINELADTKTIAYLLKYDSVYGNYDKRIEVGPDFIKIGKQKILVFSEPNPESLPWKKLGINTVIESTGIFKNKEDAMKHINAGAKKVIITAPSDDADNTIVLGVNAEKLRKEDVIVSMGSCTTNCLAPLAKVLNDSFVIRKGFMTTVHAYTNDQKILDIAHKKLRRGRAAGINMIPTNSGATESVIQVIPELKDKLDGLAIRVPIACGSVVDFVAELEREITKEEVNNAFKNAAKGKMKGILEYSEDELVSSDVIRNSNSSVVDGLCTQVIGNTVKVLSWYDNEFGYCCRLVDLLKIF